MEAVSVVIEDVLPVVITKSDHQDWQRFTEEAAKLHPLFGDAELVKKILKGAGNQGFIPSRCEKYLDDLKEFASDFEKVLDYIAKNNPRMFAYPAVLWNLLATRYKTLTVLDARALVELARDYVNTLTREYGWAMLCPVCGKPTLRDTRLDGYCRDQSGDAAETIGWRCSEGGKAHFWQHKTEKMQERARQHDH